MPARHPAPAVVVADAPGAEQQLLAAVAASEAVLVHRTGTELADGALGRLAAALHRRHRRLVRVHGGSGPCYIARSELLALVMHHGVDARDLLTDAPDLDRRIAQAAGIVHLDEPTPIEDPAVGRWRAWVDGAVIGVRPVDADDPAWQRRLSRRHGRPAALVGLARRRVGRLRREVVRRRQRPDR